MVELSVQLQTFSKDRQYDASMTLSMDSFRIRILRVSDQSLVADYAHPQSTACNSIKFFNDILSICLSNGSVLLYSVAQAAVLHTLTGLSEPCVDFCLHSNVAYALGSNGSLVEYSYPSWSKMRTTSTKKIAFKLAVSPDGKKLAIGGNQIDLIKADSFKSAGILPGHASQITNLVFLDKLLFSCAQDDRFVCCWNVKKKEIYSNFTADSPPVSIDVGGVLLAHLENGSAALWAINESTESRRPNVTVELNASDSESGLLYSALKDDEKIIVAYGNIFKPTFELVVLLINLEI
jgi:WD40 repeat protein